MKDQNYATGFVTNQSPVDVYHAVNNIGGWWTENVAGASQKLNDEFEVRFGDVHYSRQKLTTAIPGKKVVWLITDSKLTFVETEDEWTGTEVIFDIIERDNKTQLLFTHSGLTPKVECYNGCSAGWAYYINSLHQFIETGAGVPEKLDSDQ